MKIQNKSQNLSFGNKVTGIYLFQPKRLVRKAKPLLQNLAEDSVVFKLSNKFDYQTLAAESTVDGIEVIAQKTIRLGSKKKIFQGRVSEHVEKISDETFLKMVVSKAKEAIEEMNKNIRIGDDIKTIAKREAKIGW